jgi:hypothetical protein
VPPSTTREGRTNGFGQGHSKFLIWQEFSVARFCGEVARATLAVSNTGTILISPGAYLVVAAVGTSI